MRAANANEMKHIHSSEKKKGQTYWNPIASTRSLKPFRNKMFASCIEIYLNMLVEIFKLDA